MDAQQERIALLEGQVQKLQEKITENSSSQVRLDHLKGVQEREKEEWRESKRVLEENLTKTRQECQQLKKEAQGSRNGVRGWERSEEAPPTGIMHRVGISLSENISPHSLSLSLCAVVILYTKPSCSSTCCQGR